MTNFDETQNLFSVIPNSDIWSLLLMQVFPSLLIVAWLLEFQLWNKALSGWVLHNANVKIQVQF